MKHFQAWAEKYGNAYLKKLLATGFDWEEEAKNQFSIHATEGIKLKEAFEPFENCHSKEYLRNKPTPQGLDAFLELKKLFPDWQVRIARFVYEDRDSDDIIRRTELVIPVPLPTGETQERSFLIE